MLLISKTQTEHVQRNVMMIKLATLSEYTQLTPRYQYNIHFFTTLYLEISLPRVTNLPMETRGTELTSP